jgi:hypothetical protein
VQLYPVDELVEHFDDKFEIKNAKNGDSDNKYKKDNLRNHFEALKSSFFLLICSNWLLENLSNSRCGALGRHGVVMEFDPCLSGD